MMRMGQWDIRLIGASYKKLEGDLAIHLYGKTQDGKSVAVKYFGFEPYFYVVEPPGDVLEMLQGKRERVRKSAVLMNQLLMLLPLLILLWSEDGLDFLF